MFKGLRLNFYRTLAYQYLANKLYTVMKSDYTKLISGEYHNGKQSDYFILFISSWSANALITYMLYPLEVIKTKMMSEIASEADPRYSTIRQGMNTIKASWGFQGLYRGLIMKLSFMGLQFSSLTAVYYLLEKEDGSMNKSINSFLLLTGVNLFIFYPWDTIMKNVQLQGFMNVRESILGNRKVLANTFRAGPVSLYAGAQFYLLNNLLVLGLQTSGLGFYQK